MDLSTPVTVGSLYLAIPAFFFLFYARIIYIFLSRKKYRSLECYQIMAQMGISQCLCVVPPFIAFGFSLILQQDYLGIANLIIKLCPAFQRTESCLCFVLALNRLKIITSVGFPNVIHKSLVIASWLLGVAIFICLLTPCCEYGIYPGKLTTAYGSSPSTFFFQRSTSYIQIVLPVFSFAIYIFIICYLLKLKLSLGQHNFLEEKSMFIFSFTRALLDVTFGCLYHYGKFSSPIDSVVLLVAVLVGNTGVPPLMYLMLCKQLRKEFCSFGRSKMRPMIVTTLS